MSVALSCPRCGGEVRPPDLMHSEWRCDTDGPVEPLHVAEHISLEIVSAVRERVLASDAPVPMWCPWPLLPGWTVTGVGWAGDERHGPRATVVTVSGPAPVEEGPADVAFVAEQPGVGLGNRLAGIPGLSLDDKALDVAVPHAKVRAAGHPTPLWAVGSGVDRSVYIGEAKGVWIYAVAWPANTGFLLADQIVLHDLTDSIPTELVFGAPSPYLHGGA